MPPQLKSKTLWFLLALALLSSLYAIGKKPKPLRKEGLIETSGEVISTKYNRVLVLTEGNKLLLFKARKGKPLYVGDKVFVKGSSKGFFLKRVSYRVRRDFLQRLRVKVHNFYKRKIFQTQRSRFARKLALALLLGENWFSKKERLKISRIGIYHLIVISGMHFALFLTLFLLLPVRFKIRHWVALLFFAFFALLVLFPKAPTLRTFFSISLMLIAALRERPYSALKALLVAYSVSLLLFPHWIYNFGFWLSYLASGVLILHFGSRTPPEGSFFLNIFGKTVGLEASTVVMAAIAPILVYYLHYLSLGTFFYTPIYTFLVQLYLFVGAVNLITLFELSLFTHLQERLADAFGYLLFKTPPVLCLNFTRIPKAFVFLLPTLFVLSLLFLKTRRETLLVSLLFLVGEIILFRLF